MQKKAQVTPFLLIGLGTLAVLGYVVYMGSVNQRARVGIETEKLSSLQLQITPLNNFMTNCIHTLLQDTLDETGLDETQIASALQDKISSTCDLQTFQDRGVEIQTEKPEVYVTLEPNQVIVLKIRYPITLKQGAETKTIQEFTTTLPLQTTQSVTLDTTDPSQPKTTQPITLLSPDNKLDLTIQKDTTFYDSEGTPLQPEHIRLTLTPLPNPEPDAPSNIVYVLQLIETGGAAEPAYSVTNPTHPPGSSTPPLQATVYGSSDLSLYYYDDTNPLEDPWKEETTTLNEETEETTELAAPLDAGAIYAAALNLVDDSKTRELLEKLGEETDPKKQDQLLNELNHHLSEEVSKAADDAAKDMDIFLSKSELQKDMEDYFETGDPSLLIPIQSQIGPVANTLLGSIQTYSITLTNTLADTPTTTKTQTQLTSPVKKATKLKKGKKNARLS